MLQDTACAISTLELPLLNEQAWGELLHFLYKVVGRYVYTHRIEAWQGQEAEIIEDGVMETITKVLAYMRNHQDHPIENLKSFAGKTARNHLCDLSRKEGRLRHLPVEEDGQENTFLPPIDDPAEDVIEHVFCFAVLEKLPDIIVNFPKKRQKAMLVDIARYTDFDEEHVTELEQIFSSHKIELREYQQHYPLASEASKKRHASLVSLGYRQLREKVTVLL